MKYQFLLLTSAISSPVLAQPNVIEAYTSAVIGGASIVGLVVIVGVYRLGMMLYSKAKLAYTGNRERWETQRPHTMGSSLNASMSISLSTPSFPSGLGKGLQNAPMSSAPPATAGISVSAGNAVCTSLTNKGAGSSSPPDDCWFAAFAEFDSSDRRLGLWSKVFAEALGNESVAKAKYLEVRAQELHDAALQQKEVRRRDAEELETEATLVKALAVDPASLKTATDCEAHFRALGFSVRKPAAGKWEVSGQDLGTSYVYSLEGLQSHAAWLTDFFRRKRGYSQSG